MKKTLFILSTLLSINAANATKLSIIDLDWTDPTETTDVTATDTTCVGLEDFQGADQFFWDENPIDLGKVSYEPHNYFDYNTLVNGDDSLIPTVDNDTDKLILVRFDIKGIQSWIGDENESVVIELDRKTRISRSAGKTDDGVHKAKIDHVGKRKDHLTFKPTDNDTYVGYMLVSFKMATVVTAKPMHKALPWSSPKPLGNDLETLSVSNVVQANAWVKENREKPLFTINLKVDKRDGNRRYFTLDYLY